MYNDIEELIKEVEQFKKNIKDSGELCRLLAEISEQIKKNETAYDQRSEALIAKHQLLFESQQAAFEKKYSDFLRAFSDALNIIKAQQDYFKEKSDEILNRFNKLDLEVLLIEKKANTKILILLAGVGVAIVLGVIGLFI